MVLAGQRFLRARKHVGSWTAGQHSSRGALRRPIAVQQLFDNQQDIICSTVQLQKAVHLRGKIIHTFIKKTEIFA
jgi:hypothetical protein